MNIQTFDESKNKNSENSVLCFILQPTVADCFVNDASRNLPIWMAIHTIHTGTSTCYACPLLYIFANSIPKQIG